MTVMADLAHAAENDTDLFGDPDASHWAQRFVLRVRQYPGIPADEGAMLAWFAGAIEAGRMAQEKADLGDHTTAVLRRLLEHLGDRYGALFIEQLARDMNTPVPIGEAAAEVVPAPVPAGELAARDHGSGAEPGG